MRFKQFILESELTPEELAYKVFQECKPYLTEIGNIVPNNFLKRGMGDLNKDWAKLDAPKNRKPKDTLPQLHILLDHIMKQQGGVFFRSNAIFGVSKFSSAQSYGKVYYVFPIGEFEYAWSPVIDDAYTFFDNHEHDITPLGLKEILRAIERYDEIDKFKNVNIATNDWFDVVAEYMNTIKPYIYNKDLSKALLFYDDHEIMIHAKEFYYVRATNGRGDFNDMFFYHLQKFLS